MTAAKASPYKFRRWARIRMQIEVVTYSVSELVDYLFVSAKDGVQDYILRRKSNRTAP